MRMTFLLGPSVSTHFYNARDELMSQQEVYGYSVPTFGNDVVFAVDDKVRAEQFQMLGNALKSSKMNSYVPTFVKETRDFFREWGTTGVTDFKKTFNTLILFTASATIMGKEVRENIFEEVTHLYDQLDQGKHVWKAKNCIETFGGACLSARDLVPQAGLLLQACSPSLSSHHTCLPLFTANEMLHVRRSGRFSSPLLRNVELQG